MEKSILLRFPDQLIILTVATLLIVLPSVFSTEMMQGTVCGKMFFFLYTMLIGIGLVVIKIVVKSTVCFRFSIIDVFSLIWVFYILWNGFFHQMPFSHRFYELLGLIVFYILVRQVDPSKQWILLTAMLLGGAIQAVYGNLQLWGYYPSHHILFRITGSFYNPGPFAGYLSGVFPIALSFCLFKMRPLIIRWIAFFALMVILLILLPSQSRASWTAVVLSSSVLLIARYPVMKWIKKQSRLLRGLMLLSVCVLISMGIFGFFQLKTDSVNGRFLIWKVTSTMIAEHPVNGVGFDRFKANYMIGQAAYFEQMTQSPETMFASDVNFAFNEFLQHTAENGLVGLALMLTLLFVAFRVSVEPFNVLAVIAKAGIIGIAVFSFFSYPAQILPIKMTLTFYLACLASISEKRVFQPLRALYIPLKCFLITGAIASVLLGVNHLSIFQKAWNSWQWAYRVYATGNYAGSLPDYEKAWPVLKTNGDYLTHYGKALCMAGEFKRALPVLQQAVLFFPNTVVLTTLGDSYKALGKPDEAEQSYLIAWYMNPSRFYPKYLLAKLYDETGQIEKAKSIARNLLYKEVKINSKAIDEIREEMELILQKHQ